MDSKAQDSSWDKVYLGDSVYAEFDGYMVTLTTDNGFGPSNTIHLEPGVLRALEAFSRRVGARSDARAGLLDALRATVTPLIRLGDFVGNEDTGGASGLGPFDRCAIINQVRDAIDAAEKEQVG